MRNLDSRFINEDGVKYLFDGRNLNDRMLSFKKRKRGSDKKNDCATIYTERCSLQPDIVLDAPGTNPDYYSHLIDWGHDNILIYASEDTIYSKKYAPPEGSVCDKSLNKVYHAKDETFLIAKMSKTNNLIVAATESREFTIMKDFNYIGRVSCGGVIPSNVHPESMWVYKLCGVEIRDSDTFWFSTFNGLGMVDIRDHTVSRKIFGIQRIFDIKKHPTRPILAVTDSHSDSVYILDERMLSKGNEIAKLKHASCVKGLEWSPWKDDIILTGSGLNERKLKEWSIYNDKKPLREFKTRRQITGIAASLTKREFVVASGFPSNDDHSHMVTLWDWNKFRPVQLLNSVSDDGRMLCLTKSLNGKYVAAISSDETLEIWKVW
jgi:hypothetical protein